MPRSGDPARRRLREAALELYREHGYDLTTTAQIAAAAGTTERTYFRHFADKREVLFDGEGELRKIITEAIAAAPATLSPLAAVLAGYTAAIPLLIRNRPIAQQRMKIIATSPALQERAHAKNTALIAAVTSAVAERGFAAPTARLAAQVGAAVFEQAQHAWADDGNLDLPTLVAHAADDLQRIGNSPALDAQT